MAWRCSAQNCAKKSENDKRERKRGNLNERCERCARKKPILYMMRKRGVAARRVRKRAQNDDKDIIHDKERARRAEQRRKSARARKNEQKARAKEIRRKTQKEEREEKEENAQQQER